MPVPTTPQPVNPTPTASAPAPMSEQKSIILPIIISIVLTALFVGGGVFAWQYMISNSMKEKLENQISLLEDKVEKTETEEKLELTELKLTEIEEKKEESPIKFQPALIMEPIDTGDWKTYEDETLGFSFKYPNNLFTHVTKNDQGDYYIDIDEYEVQPQAHYMGIRFSVRDVSENLYKYAQERYLNYSTEMMGTGLQDEKTEFIKSMVDGNDVYIVGRAIYLAKNGKVYSFFDSNMDTGNSKTIANTFNFVK